MSLAFHDSGEIEQHAVVFVHSLCCSSAMWTAPVAALKSTGRFRTIQLDLRGHGRSAANHAECSIENLADDVIKLVDDLGVEKFSFVGSSIGGLIGLQLASRYSHRLCALVLSNTGPAMLPKERWNQRIEQVKNGQFEQLAKSNIERWVPDQFKKNETLLTSSLIETAVRTDAESYARLCAAIREADFRNDLNKITMPVLVTGSTQDVSPVRMAQELAAAIAGSTLKIFTESGHLSSVDQPLPYSATLVDFLTRIKDHQPLGIPSENN